MGALDGVTRWTRPPYGMGHRYDDHAIFASRRPGEPPTGLLDAATGRPRSELGRSRQLGELLVRSDETGRTWVYAPGPGDGTPRVIGAVDGVAADRCTAADGYLACPTVTGETHVWRLPTTGLTATRAVGLRSAPVGADRRHSQDCL